MTSTEPPPAGVHLPSFLFKISTSSEPVSTEKGKASDKSSAMHNEGKNVLQGDGDGDGDGEGVGDAFEHSGMATVIHSDEKVVKGGGDSTRSGKAVQIAFAEGVDDQSEDDNCNGFPPLLTSLNKNGRPRFDLVKISEEGRLRIVMVPKERPEVLKSPVRDGRRLKLRLMDGEDSGGEQVSPPSGGSQDGRNGEELLGGGIFLY